MQELSQAYLERIEAIDQAGPKLNACTHVLTSLEEAESLDEHFKRTGEFVGPLHGVPVLVKDQVETKGFPTAYGSIIAKDNRPSEDATLITRLKAAGALILGKTAMPGKATSSI